MKLNAISRLDPGPGKENYKNQGNLNMDETLVDNDEITVSFIQLK